MVILIDQDNGPSPTPADDSPLSRLTDACLMKIVSHLPTSDWIRLAQCHPRVKSLITSNGLLQKDVIQLNFTLLREYPINTTLWAYKALLQNATSLTITAIREDHLPRVLPLCPQLRHLSLMVIELTDMAAIGAYPRVESLTLNEVRADKKYLVKLFKHLDSGLRVVDFGSDLPKALECLHSLREVHVCNKALIKDMTPWLKQNVKTLQRIFIGETDKFDYKEEKRFKKMCDHNKATIKVCIY